jgi:hypothetical protein
MRFNEWIDEYNKSIKAAAGVLNMKYMRVYRIYHGAEPSLTEVLDIGETTNGAVTPHDFIMDAKEKRKQ